MNSPLNLQLPNVIQIFNPSQLPDFCNWHIPCALMHLFNVSGGQFLRQSLSGFLVHTELFEYRLAEPLSIRGEKKESAINMFMMLKGSTSIFDEDDQLIEELTTSSYHIASVPAGNYTAKFTAGDHKLLVFTFLPEWFIQNISCKDEFKDLITHYLDQASEIFALPYCPLNRNTVWQLKKHLTTDTNIKNTNSDFLSTYLLQLARSYKEMLNNNNFTTNVIHQILAADILLYIQSNFDEQFLDNCTEIARYFNTSASLLRSIFKEAYGEPMGKRINLLRINLAMILVSRTTKPIGKIAQLSGFKDRHYFSRAFKMNFHETATKVRKKGV